MLILQILKVIILRNNYNDRIFVSFFQSTMRTSLNISAQLTTTAANRVSWTNESYSTWVEFDMRYKLTKEKGCWYIRQMAPHHTPPPSPPHPRCILSWNSCNLSKQLLFDSGPGAAVGGMRIEINTGYSCYLICNSSQHKMALQSTTEHNSYSSFSDILVFGCLCQLFK